MKQLPLIILIVISHTAYSQLSYNFSTTEYFYDVQKWQAMTSASFDPYEVPVKVSKKDYRNSAVIDSILKFVPRQHFVKAIRQNHKKMLLIIYCGVFRKKFYYYDLIKIKEWLEDQKKISI